MTKIKLVVTLILGLFLFLIIVQNTTPIPGRFLWFSMEVPAVVLLLVAAAGGFVLGLLVIVFLKRDA